MVNLIRSAIARLTLSYLAIIMALALTFSFVLYRISSHELDQELRRPTVLEFRQSIDPLSFDNFRNARITISQQNLKQGLIVFNLGTLVLGSLVSYLLARHTLEPVEKAMEAQSRFTADASHELRTPLTAMQTEIEVTLRNKKLTAVQAKALLKSNLEEINKLRSLADGLLRLARNEEFVLKKVAVNPIVEQAVKQMNSLMDTKQIKIIYQLSTFKVLADSQGLKDVIVILLDNAIKYSPPHTTITISGQQKDNHGEIIIKDQGPGIKSHDMPHIFERFYRADQSRTNNQTEGHGLGLSIAKQIMEAQNGQITATSQAGEGSTFTIRLNS